MTDTIIDMGEAFLFSQLIEKLRELNLPDLFSENGAPLESSWCSGATGIDVQVEDYLDEDVPIVSFDEYDWPKNSYNVDKTIFDLYDNVQDDKWPHYVCIRTYKNPEPCGHDKFQLATQLVIRCSDTHRYAFLR